MRLFIAICFSDNTRKRLCDAVEALRGQGQGRFSPAENLHLTLAFLGETEDAASAAYALSQVRFPNFSIRFESIGQFGDLYWAGIRPNTKLNALQSQLIGHLKAVGFTLEEREFIPHITLARRYVPNQSFSSVSQILSGTDEPIREIALMRSLPCENGTYYEVLATQPLTEK